MSREKADLLCIDKQDSEVFILYAQEYHHPLMDPALVPFLQGRFPSPPDLSFYVNQAKEFEEIVDINNGAFRG